MLRSANRQPPHSRPRMYIGCSRARVSAIKRTVPANLLIESRPLFFLLFSSLEARTWRPGRRKTSPANWTILSADERCRQSSGTFFSTLLGIRGNYRPANDRSFSLSLSIFSKIDRANNEHCVRYYSVSTKRLEGLY